nr:MAG TPA: Camelysin metallo-endopeptidase [Caudoviricetes sp.]
MQDLYKRKIFILLFAITILLAVIVSLILAYFIFIA